MTNLEDSLRDLKERKRAAEVAIVERKLDELRAKETKPRDEAAQVRAQTR